MTRGGDQPGDPGVGGSGAGTKRAPHAPHAPHAPGAPRAARTRRAHVRDLVAQSTLPQVIQDTIVAVVGRTRLRRGERFEIARELVTHFEDGLQAGREPDELIASFGDARQAAALIRRARRRQRSLAWHAWRRTWQGAAALFGLILAVYTWSYIRMVTASPVISHDYLADLNARAASVPTDQRAWPLVREAMLAVNADRTIDHRFAGARPGEEGWEAFRPILESHFKALDLLRSVRNTPGLGYLAGHEVLPEDWMVFYPTQPYESPAAAGSSGEATALDRSLFTVLLPQLSVLRRASTWLKSDVWLALESGDGNRVAANLEAMLTLAQHAAEAPLLINQLVKIAILHMTLNEIALVLHEHPAALSDEHLQRLLHRLGTFDGGGSIALDYNGERAFFYDLLQRIYSDDGKGDGRLTAKGLRSLHGLGVDSPDAAPLRTLDPLMPIYGLVAAGRRDMADAYESLIGAIEEWARTPLWERATSPIPPVVERLQSTTLDRVRYQMITMLVGGLEASASSSEFTAQARDAVLAIIALELHRRERGAYPEALEALMPTYLPALPIDRFTGQPLRYEIVNGVPRLWSVGADLDDDGGVRMTYPPGSDGPQLPTGRWLPREEVERLKREGNVGNPSAHAPLPDADWVFWPLKD